eukprot:TRINITY_DN351_c0_g1_i1.p2 TRINITY_DN351_c0_g1~~TRINITY_DN351_c0_g1_i1.p2  ORF type:complete len:235 (+),score=58.07 TRINITY_DN351_c0_g1_i1:68-772(+)
MAQPDAPEVFANGPSNVTFGDNIPGYLSSVSSDSKVGVVVVQEWWGMNISITKTADIIAAEGFRALVPDLYRGKVAKNGEEAGHILSGLDWPKAVADIRAAAQYLLSIGCTKVGVTGFCMGGALTIASATSVDELSAAVPFYGVPDLSFWPASNIKVPILAHFGRDDTMKGFSDPEAAENLESTLKAAGKDIQIHMWDGAGHAFMNRDRPSAYRPEIAAQALKETTDFFKKHLA